MINAASGQAQTLTSVRLVCRNVMCALRLFYRHGYTNALPYYLAAYAGFRAAVLRDLRGVERHVEAAQCWKTQISDPVYGAKAEYLLQEFSYGWIRPRREVVGALLGVAEELREVGDIQDATNAHYLSSRYLALSGACIPAVLEAFRALPTRLDSDPSGHAESLSEPYLRLSNPALGIDQPMLDRVQAALARPSSYASQLAADWLACLCYWGDPRAALRISEPVRALVLERLSTSSHVADYMFFRGVAAAMLVGTARGRARMGFQRELRASLRQLRIWARHGPDFVHMAQLLEAERARLRGAAERALSLYWKTAERASSNGYQNHLALVYERQAILLREGHRYSQAEEALRNASEAYAAWGAHCKVIQLRTRLGQLI